MADTMAPVPERSLPLKFKAARLKSRLREACDSCAAGKVRCGGEKPICARCRNNARSCVYSISRRSGRPPKTVQAEKEGRSEATFDSRRLGAAGTGTGTGTTTTNPTGTPLAIGEVLGGEPFPLLDCSKEQEGRRHVATSWGPRTAPAPGNGDLDGEYTASDQFLGDAYLTRPTIWPWDDSDLGTSLAVTPDWAPASSSPSNAAASTWPHGVDAGAGVASPPAAPNVTCSCCSRCVAQEDGAHVVRVEITVRVDR